MPAQANREVRRAVDKAAKKVANDRTQDKARRRGAPGMATSASEWRQSRKPVLVELPSGNICRAINKGLNAFLKGGKIPNALMPIITKALADGEGRRTSSDIGSGILEDPEMLEQAVELVYVIVCDCVTEPVIRPVPKEDDGNGVMVDVPLEERDEIPDDQLWVDEIDLDDGFFIMNWVVGGTQDVEQFRSQLAESVGGLQPGNEPEPAAE